ncbi:TPA: hypothetical protein HA265_00770 [Candidatus Woesearchaeota archaeon]|nr:hypothetical protein [Candidatus Woesearchaeota archaeon]
MGFGIKAVIFLGAAAAAYLSKNGSVQVSIGGLLVAAVIYAFVYIYQAGKFAHTGDVKKAQKELKGLIKDDEHLLKKISIEKKKKGMNEEQFHDYMTGELAELDTRIKGKFEMLAHKKLAICASLIQIFQNMDESSQQHALKDHYLQWKEISQDKPADNKHGADRRRAVNEAMAKLDSFANPVSITEYGRALHKRYDETQGFFLFEEGKGLEREEQRRCMMIINNLKTQQEAIHHARGALDHQLRSNHAMMGLFHHANIFGVINPLKKYYEAAQEELKATHELFELNDSFRKRMLAHGKKAQ